MSDTTTTPEPTPTAAEMAELRARLARSERRAEAAEAKAAAVEAERDAERTRATEARIAEAIISAASEAGILDPELAPKIIDRDLIQVTDDGRVKGCKAAVAAFLTDHPAFPRKDAPPAPRGGTPPRPAPKRPEHRPQGERLDAYGFPVDSLESQMMPSTPFKM